MRERKTLHSATYQWMYHERVLMTEDGFNLYEKHPAPKEICDEERLFLEARQDLLMKLYKRVETALVPHLTDRQIDVLADYVHGVTQLETAARLGINQSSVVKSKLGNMDYRKGYGIAYGGY